MEGSTYYHSKKSESFSGPGAQKMNDTNEINQTGKLYLFSKAVAPLRRKRQTSWNFRTGSQREKILKSLFVSTSYFPLDFPGRLVRWSTFGREWTAFFCVGLELVYYLFRRLNSWNVMKLPKIRAKTVAVQLRIYLRSLSSYPNISKSLRARSLIC